MNNRRRVRYLFIVLLTASPAALGQAPVSAPPADGATAPGETGSAALPSDVNELLRLATEALRRAEKGEDTQAADVEAVRKYLDELQRLAPTSERAAFLRARGQILVGRGKEALKTIDDYANSREGQNDWEAHKILGFLYLQGTHHRLARDSYLKAAALNANDAEVQAGLAACEYQLGRKDEAVKLIEKAVELDKESLSLRDTFVQILMGTDAIDRAINVAIPALDLAKARANNQRGSVRALLTLDGKYATLDGVLAAAIRKNPTNAKLYLRQAQYAQERGDLAPLLALHRASQEIDKGIRAGAQHIVPLYVESARVNMLLDRPEEARKALDEVDRLEPANPDAAELRKLLEQPDAAPVAPDPK